MNKFIAASIISILMCYCYFINIDPDIGKLTSPPVNYVFGSNDSKALQMRHASQAPVLSARYSSRRTQASSWGFICQRLEGLMGSFDWMDEMDGVAPAT